MLSSVQKLIYGSPETSRPSLYHPHYRRPEEAVLEVSATRSSAEFRRAFRELVQEFADVAIREAARVRRSVASVHETIRRSISSRRGSLLTPRGSSSRNYELLEDDAETNSILTAMENPELARPLDLYLFNEIAHMSDMVSLDPGKPYLAERLSWLDSVKHVYFHIPGLYKLDSKDTLSNGDGNVSSEATSVPVVSNENPSTPLRANANTSGITFIMIHDIQGVSGYATYLKYSVNGVVNEWRANMFRKRIFSVDISSLRRRAESLPPISRSSMAYPASSLERESLYSERELSDASSLRPSKVQRHKQRLFRPWYYKLKSYPIWVGIMFLIGSIIFTFGSAMSYIPAVTNSYVLFQALIGWPFLVGSVFYTVGAYVRILEVLNSPPVHPMINDEDSIRLSVSILEHRKTRFFGWEPWRWDFLGALIQQIGACLYNINCFVGNGNKAFTLSFYETQFILWLPDTLGSVCFVVSAYFFIVEYGHKWWTWDPKSFLYWTVFCNFMGAIGFLLNGVFGFGEYAFPADSLYVYIGSDLPLLFGCICFSLGGLFLILEQSLPDHYDLLSALSNRSLD
eukprot:jgi/Galph1/4969/GphlegSOOS_G3648.1